MPRRVTVAVVSDLHFCNERPVGSGSELSHIVIQRLHEEDGKNPWADLRNFVKENRLSADMLLCPGDITTHAAHGPLKAAWNGLVALGKDLNTSLVACATGNHDVSSRITDAKDDPIHDLNNPHDLFENLKLLKPEYPLHIYAENDPQSSRKRRVHYFGADFVMHEDENVRLVIFNSCARHITEKSSYERGIIAQSALDELSSQLNENTSDKINIFLCHHHPIQHSDVSGGGSYDFILNGDKLITYLADHGDWIIIHGHKHDGRIFYAGNGSIGSAPVVISASSMGAIFSSDELNRYRNQFYIIDVELPNSGCTLGTLKIWNWHCGQGWSKAINAKAGLTDGVGFGERTHSDTLAKQIADRIGNTPTPWRTLTSEFSFLAHLTPDSLKGLLKSLKNKHKIIEIRDENSGRITEIGPEA